jgi:hypothetical protein
MKNSDRILRRLLQALETWSDGDLRKFAELLADAKWRAQATRQLCSRSAQSAQGIQEELSTFDQPELRRKSRQKDMTPRFRGRDAEREFVDFACDANRFPSLTTFLRVLNAVWGPIYSLDEFKGSRRRNVARRIWKDLLLLSEERRETRLQRLAAAADARDANAYLELFKKIVEK